MKKIAAFIVAVLVVLGTGQVATAADNDPVDMATCRYMASVWESWAKPMGVVGRCWYKDDVPWAEYGWQYGDAGGWAELTTRGWTTANAVVEGDHKWLWHVFAHEMGHQWGHRVADVYGLKPAIMRVMGWNIWHEEPWADVFSTCLGWMPYEVSRAFNEPRAATWSQCVALDAIGAMPHTAPRGFQPI